jgi:mannose-6-phosphate isomerase-like protein (cupin superfamily)
MITKLFDPTKSSTSPFCGQHHDLLTGAEYSPDIALFIDIEATTAHYHNNFDEVYFVVSGAITLKLYDPATKETTTQVLKENDLCVITKGVHHRIVDSSLPNRLTVISKPNYNKADMTLSDVLK